MAKTVTSIAQIRCMHPENEVVTLPGWEDGQEISVRLRRCTLRGLALRGAIPNVLMPAAQRLYDGANSKATASFKETSQVMEILVENSLVEPTYKDFQNAGIELTEEQTALIIGYATRGAKALEAFRNQLAGAVADTNSERVEKASERAAES